MKRTLTDAEIIEFKSKAAIETDREIYDIGIDGKEIAINRSWSIKRNKKPINNQIVEAIEEYCTKKNIEWEYQAEYSAWCD